MLLSCYSHVAFAGGRSDIRSVKFIPYLCPYQYHHQDSQNNPNVLIDGKFDVAFLSDAIAIPAGVILPRRQEMCMCACVSVCVYIYIFRYRHIHTIIFVHMMHI